MGMIYYNGQSYCGNNNDSPSIVVDDTLSDVSINPVQNKVIKAELDKKLDDFNVTVEGSSVVLDGLGLQDSIPFSKIVVKSKNLATVPQNVILFGNTTNGFRIDESETGKSYIIPIKHNTQYTFSNHRFGDRLRIVLFKEYPTNTLNTNTKSIIFRETEIENYPVVTFNSDNYNYCVITVNRDVSNFTPMVQLEIGDSATEYIHPIIGKNLRITTFRKNLLPVEAMGEASGNIHLEKKEDGYILLSGNSNFTSDSELYIAQNINMTITKNMILSYFGNISGATPNATITRNGETIELTLNENGEKLQPGDILNSVYIQILEMGIEVSGAGRFYLELESDFVEYNPSYKYDYFVTPDSNPYTVPFEIYQRDGLNYAYVTGLGEPVLTITGVKTNAAVKKIWENMKDNVQPQPDWNEDDTNSGAYILNKPTSLPANGGNADTVGGLQVNEIASNSNLLINPDFRVNQRGKTEYTGDGYTVDRWRQNEITITTLKDSGIAISKTKVAYELEQPIENYSNIVGQTVTLSISTSIGDTSVTVIAPEATEESVEAIITLPDGTLIATDIYFGSFRIFGNIDGVTIYWAKLELGSIATPFMPPDPATELVKCQRYYIGSPLVSTSITKMVGALIFLFPIPTTMRINPSLLVSEWTLFDSENNNIISTIDWNIGLGGGYCSNGVIVGVVPPDTVEVGSVHEYELQINSGGFDAEIY